MKKTSLKVCTICKKEKAVSEFNKNKTRRDGLQTLCKECSKYRSRRYYGENREKHLKQIGIRRNSIKKKVRQFIFDYLLEHPCVDCGFSGEPAALDFDHVRGKKLGNVSSLAGHGMEKVRNEIAKC